MTTASRRLLANRAMGQCMIEMAQAEPQMPVGDAAYLLTREGALQLMAYRGVEKAAEALYQLADEIATVRL